MFGKRQALLVLTAALFVSGCGVGENGGEDEVKLEGINDGALVKGELIDNIDPATMLSMLQRSFPTLDNAFGYEAVKIIYNTTNEDGKAIQASGLLVIPKPTEDFLLASAAAGKPYSVSMICDNHGTIFLDSEAPSNVERSNGLPDYPQAVAMTGYAGFAAIFPDYIGFGASKGVAVHPYMLKKASAQASLDMIKASIAFMEQNGVMLNYQLYVSGYSQGGYVAMALGEKVEESFPYVDLKGVAPMAGPYNLEMLADEKLQLDYTMVYPAFLADLAYAYASYYDDLNLDDMVVPDSTLFPFLFDGEHSSVAIHVGLGLADGTTDYGFYTHKAQELFKSTFISAYNNNIGEGKALRTHFEQNDVDKWTPKTKVNLIQCVSDEIIPFKETNSTYNAMKEKGVDVVITAIPDAYVPPATPSNPFVHSRCGETAYNLALKWFDDIRRGKE